MTVALLEEKWYERDGDLAHYETAVASLEKNGRAAAQRPADRSNPAATYRDTPGKGSERRTANFAVMSLLAPPALLAFRLAQTNHCAHRNQARVHPTPISA